MNKSEFLEILKDYLKKDLSPDEVSDILRDYEEYFVDGVIEGKSDMEIIQGLGSPKSIASELIGQFRENNKETSNKDKINDKLNLYKIRVKENINKSKNYISEKLTPNLEDKDHKESRKLIQVLLSMLSLILIIPASGVLFALIGIGIALVAFIIGYIGFMILTLNFITVTKEITLLYIFGSMAFIGGQILAWQIYVSLINLCKNIVRSYINWLKTRKIYINASKKKEKNENRKNEINYDKEENKVIYDDKEDENDE